MTIIANRQNGENISDQKPTHRLFLCCSNVPTSKELEKSIDLATLLGKLDFPFRFKPLGDGEV